MLSGCASGSANSGTSDIAAASVEGTAEAMPTAGAAPTAEASSVSSADNTAAAPKETDAPSDDLCSLPTTDGASKTADGESTSPAAATSAASPAAAGTSTTAPTATTSSTAPAVNAVHDEYTGRDIGGRGTASSADTDSVSAAAEPGDEPSGDIILAESAADVDGLSGGIALTSPKEGYYSETDLPEPVPGWDITPEAGLLTGGEWNDNENWDFWQGLFGSANYAGDWEEYRQTWRTGADFRAAVTVKDTDGKPLEGAAVSAMGYSAVTDNKGRAYLFFSEKDLVNGPSEFTVTTDNGTQTFKETVNGDIELEFTLNSAATSAAKTLDLMIMCDTTGSMSDELEYLKAELEDVVTRIKAENGNIPTRLSVNFYRDEGDEYVVREFPFTTNLDAVVNAISLQSADGGGDTPEAVDAALKSALDHDWDENSVKIMFLVLDAPPHSAAQTVDKVTEYVRAAAEKGIRIIPVAASGADKSCEFILRSMAFMTGGTYTFLTDDSGIGFSHTEPSIGSYTVEKLNDMMVRICGEYLD